MYVPIASAASLYCSLYPYDKMPETREGRLYFLWKKAVFSVFGDLRSRSFCASCDTEHQGRESVAQEAAHLMGGRAQGINSPSRALSKDVSALPPENGPPLPSRATTLGGGRGFKIQIIRVA